MIFENYNNIQLLTPKELGALLQKKERTIREMVYRGKIPYLRIGHSIRFDQNRIKKWLRDECQFEPGTGEDE